MQHSYNVEELMQMKERPFFPLLFYQVIDFHNMTGEKAVITTITTKIKQRQQQPHSLQKRTVK